MMKRLSILAVLAALGGCTEGGDLGTLFGSSLASDNRGSDSERDLYLDVIAGLNQRGLYHASLAHLDEYTRRHRATERSQLLRADALASVGQREEATRLYRELLAGGSAAAAQNGLGRVAALAGDWPEAATSFQEAVARDPTNVRYLNNLGYAYLRAGDARQAEFRLRQAEELEPQNIEVGNNLTLLFLTGNRRPEGEARLARIADPNARQAIRRQAQTIAQGGPGS
ncbi:tetratricopeptide repeat protein [Plastoroseomonas hellenica]|uniref:tetratricopeptide repeat protein n=1 Tax=Plastoroseomonas hellenica TaxID=2687306 RepID=UPI001BA7E1D6|nr:tetratricopeptide repeat protein [Plastoroseomonas hellenica]MBR0646323.1 tetratricopeptide repeat protein [Plastoroseomonas hellenica]